MPENSMKNYWKEKSKKKEREKILAPKPKEKSKEEINNNIKRLDKK